MDFLELFSDPRICITLPECSFVSGFGGVVVFVSESEPCFGCSFDIGVPYGGENISATTRLAEAQGESG